MKTDSARLQRYLDQAEDQIHVARRRIDRQRRLVEQMKADGKDSAIGEHLLSHFERSLQTSLGNRDVIERLLARRRPLKGLMGLPLASDLRRRRQRAMQAARRFAYRVRNLLMQRPI